MALAGCSKLYSSSRPLDPMPTNRCKVRTEISLCRRPFDGDALAHSLGTFQAAERSDASASLGNMMEPRPSPEQNHGDCRCRGKSNQCGPPNKTIPGASLGGVTGFEPAVEHDWQSSRSHPRDRRDQLLKIYVQGAKLTIITKAPIKLLHTVALQLEVCYFHV